ALFSQLESDVDWEPVEVQKVDNHRTARACTTGRLGAAVYSDCIHKERTLVLEVVPHKEAGHRDRLGQMVAAHTEIGRRDYYRAHPADSADSADSAEHV